MSCNRKRPQKTSLSWSGPVFGSFWNWKDRLRLRSKALGIKRPDRTGLSNTTPPSTTSWKSAKKRGQLLKKNIIPDQTLFSRATLDGTCQQNHLFWQFSTSPRKRICLAIVQQVSWHFATLPWHSRTQNDTHTSFCCHPTFYTSALSYSSFVFSFRSCSLSMSILKSSEDWCRKREWSKSLWAAGSVLFFDPCSSTAWHTHWMVTTLLRWFWDVCKGPLKVHWSPWGKMQIKTEEFCQNATGLRG